MLYVTMAVVQILYVSLNSLRVVLMIKGRKYLTSLISMLEIFVYIMGLSIVLKNLQSVAGIIIYSASYGVGILLGMYLEKKIALGYITLQVISENGHETSLRLRERGYGVTTWVGQGGVGVKTISIILARRKEYNDLTATILQMDPQAFMFFYESTQSVGGFWRK